MKESTEHFAFGTNGSVFVVVNAFFFRAEFFWGGKVWEN
jgi:hypothetical protein